MDEAAAAPPCMALARVVCMSISNPSGNWLADMLWKAMPCLRSAVNLPTTAWASKLAAAWIFRQLNESRHASLEQVFASELRLGTNIMRDPEFAEGVRALLVDKDRSPQWQFDSVDAIPSAVLDGFFTAPADMPALNLPTA